MSAEAPKQTGAEPNSPPQAKSRLGDFFRNFFAVPLMPTVTQPPPELSDFTVGLRKAVAEVTNKLDTARRQAESDRIELEKQSAERASREKETREQQERRDAERRLQAFEEMKQLAEKLRIRNRLASINTTVWEGKGQIQDISSSEGRPGLLIYDPVAGYELVYSYKTSGTERKTHFYNNNPRNFEEGYSWRLVEAMESTSLRVYISCSMRMEGGKSLIEDLPYVGRGGKFLCVLSEFRGDTPYNIGLNPPGREGVEKELDQALIDESTRRVREGATPSKLSLAGQEELKKAETTPQWYKWKYVQTHFSESG